MGKIYAEVLEVGGIYSAIQGMRNPMNSWDKSDSEVSYVDVDRLVYREIIGENDMILAKKLINAGAEHRKFLRQIQVWCDISLPRYVWQELDTYKFGTKNSCSTMHTIMKKPITIDNFYIGSDPIIMTDRLLRERIIPDLNYFRDLYLETKDYRWVIEMKRILPESFIQMRTWNTNYEELLNIYHQRKHHKLKEEWKVVLDFIEELPYFKELCLEK